MRNHPYQQALKRVIDVAVAATILLVSLPVLGCLALLIRWKMGWPVLFRQQRLGRHGHVFRLYKFRTMTAGPRETGREILPDAPEVTPLGRFLRRFKIDELPQLWNVLKGDMSIVGPRPALPAQLDELTKAARKRLEVRPGLTGMSQIHGNIYLPWEERWKYDAEYVERVSFFLDCWILWRTLFTVVGGERRYLEPWKAEKQ